MIRGQLLQILCWVLWASNNKMGGGGRARLLQIEKGGSLNILIIIVSSKSLT